MSSRGYSRGRGGRGNDSGSSSGRGRGGGRGEYYRNKYGGGRGGGGGGGRGSNSSPNESNNYTKNQHQGGSYTQLLNQIQYIDGQSYPAYHDLESPTKGWNYSKNTQEFTLYIQKTQSDPFATPTSVRVVIPSSTATFPPASYATKTRAIALADYIHRIFYQLCITMGADRDSRQQEDNKSSGSGGGRGGWHGPKGGDIKIAPPCQHVLEQTAVSVNSKGDITAQFTMNLPARGRTILGNKAMDIFARILPMFVQEGLIYEAVCKKSQQKQMQHHIFCIEDQEYIRSQILPKHDWIAFVKDGSILPRASGADDTPMTTQNVIPFMSPSSMKVSIDLPSLKQTITGMAIPKGITLIVGGGFHGKSTLLDALQLGVYNKIPGDGREFVIVDEATVKIRAEDGRKVEQVDISSFINNLPMGKDTACFSSFDASGSTSQASNIIEVSHLSSLYIDNYKCIDWIEWKLNGKVSYLRLNWKKNWMHGLNISPHFLSS